MKRLVVLFALISVMFSGVAIFQAKAQTGATAVVTAYFLNVRDYPDPLIGQIIARIERGQVYEVTGRSSINNWWQIRLNTGHHGWVSGGYVAVYNAHLVPTVNPGIPPSSAPAQGTVTTGRLNVRSIPNPYTGAIIHTVSNGDVFPVIGRNADSSWWQIRLNGTSGWVNGRYLSVSTPGTVPQTDTTTPVPPVQPPPPAAATGTVTAYYLNVRTYPDPNIGQIIHVIGRDEQYPVVGRTSTMSWWQIRLPDGRTGWVSDRYLRVVNFQNVPVVTPTGPTVPPPQPVGATGTVNTFFLNVRTWPNPVSGQIFEVVSLGQVLPVIGRIADSSWWQVRLPDGRTGWVWGFHLNVVNGHTVPITL